jgi:predicted ATPase/DNA-binding SARP family transcriptional activator
VSPPRLPTDGSVAPPVPLTSFVGRARELEDVVRLLRGARLLTLTGVGGSGKTRLALGAAARMSAEDGVRVVWVELAPVADAELLETAVIGASGVREHGKRHPFELLVEELGHGSRLLVLDNCEHLVAGCAVLSETLLRSCPTLRILATSREPLGTPAEVTWLVPPLAWNADPRHGTTSGPLSDAAQLFLERARAVAPDFQISEANAAAVNEICQRLDGMPLAIELAAARLRVLAPGQIAERLNDCFRLLSSGSRTALPRHRTLQAVIDWSYDLLSASEQRLLARLSVFSGTFDLQAVEEICAAEPLQRVALLDLLSALVEKSLVETATRDTAARYRLLETVRQYAANRLNEVGEDADLRRRHAEYYAQVAAAAKPWLTSSRRAQWVRRLQSDVENLHTAIVWSRSSDTELHLRILGDLNFLWVGLGLSAEARHWVEKALRLPGAERPTPGRASALSCAGYIAAQQGHFDIAHPWLEEAARLWETFGDHREAGYTLNNLGSILMFADPAAGNRLMLRTRDAFRALGDRFGEAWALNNRAVCLQGMGDLEAAVEAAEQAATLAREDGAAGTLAIALLVLGAALYHAGRPEPAAANLEEAAALFRHDVHPAVARLLELYSATLAQRGEMEAAAQALGAGDAVRQRMGMAPAERDPPPWAEVSASVRARLTEPVLAAAWRKGLALDTVGALDWVIARAGIRAGQSAGGRDSHAREPVPFERRSEDAGDLRVAAGPADATAVPATLRVLALGPLQVYRRGELLPPDSWGSAKPRELLLFLLTHPDGCTKEQVGLALWPDASPAQLRNSFHTTMHRLRKVLGEDWISFAADRYRLDPPGGVEFDADVFMRAMTAALRETGAGADIDRLGTALALYRSGFLEGEPVGDWHLELRERLQRLYLDGLAALGTTLLQVGRYPEARDVLQRLVRLDDLNESAYRHLMLCHSRLGERAQALRLFRRLTVLLDEELATQPEPETLALARQLKVEDGL